MNSLTHYSFGSPTLSSSLPSLCQTLTSYPNPPLSIGNRRKRTNKNKSKGADSRKLYCTLYRPMGNITKRNLIPKHTLPKEEQRKTAYRREATWNYRRNIFPNFE